MKLIIPASMSQIGSKLATLAKDADAGRVIWEAEKASNEALTEEVFGLGIVKYNYTQYRQVAAYLMVSGTTVQIRMYGLQLYFNAPTLWTRIRGIVVPFIGGMVIGSIGYLAIRIYPRRLPWSR